MTQTIEQLQARVAELEAENARLKSRGDNHWETLRSIRSIARVTGDLESIIQHVTDSGSGYTKTAEVTMWELSQQLLIAQAENATLHEQVDLQIPALAFKQLQEQLLSAQYDIKLLRDALQEYIDEHEECQDADDWMAMMCSVEAHHTADEALSQPSDTSALDTFVAEKVKEAYIPVTIDYGDGAEDVAFGNEHQARRLKRWLDKFFAQKEQITTLTRQRDLAVEALRNCASKLESQIARNPDLPAYYREVVAEAFRAIKESEGE